MNIIAFPGIGLEMKVPQIAFSLFGIDIYYYSICIVLGIVVALFLCKLCKENYNIQFDITLEIILLAIVFGICGARLYYVIFNLNYYLQNPLIY